MTDYAADAPTEAGTTTTLRSGSAAADTVPAGCVMAIQNTGAGSHTVDLSIGFSWHGLAPGDPAAAGKRRLTLPAGTWQLVRVSADYGDASQRVTLTISGTQSEIKFLLIGA